MGSAIQIPLQDYLNGSFEFEPDAEFVDGEIEERPMGEYDHTTWQEALLAWYRANGKGWNVRARPELRVMVSPTRYRVPDVVVLRRDIPVEQVVTHPPVAVFEVLSPEDRMSRMLVKLSDYEKMGIRTIRVIDPKTRALYRFEQGKLEPIKFAVEEIPGEPAGFLDWKAIEELLD